MARAALRIVHTILHILHNLWNEVETSLLRPRHSGADGKDACASASATTRTASPTAPA